VSKLPSDWRAEQPLPSPSSSPTSERGENPSIGEGVRASGLPSNGRAEEQFPLPPSFPRSPGNVLPICIPRLASFTFLVERQRSTLQSCWASERIRIVSDSRSRPNDWV